MVPLHMGALHPYEQALTLLLAFGPFVVLGIVVWRRARNEDPEDSEGHDGSGDHGATPDPSVVDADPRP